ncbi:MAG: heavy-metal-associated domain-containing protein [Erysipelotrichaceae bacterium]|nr:heavy-metal-associated domain-containing protein [Erysipelotrichaceae bacterium]MCI9312011.1 heavy-metal-associated domain-containing protein [Erysipelotrichaceae bacterium]
MTRQKRGERMKTITYQVSGMMCANCENRVCKALNSMEGVIKAQADAKTGTVKCEYEETKTNEAAIKACIEEVGYDVIM